MPPSESGKPCKDVHQSPHAASRTSASEYVLTEGGRHRGVGRAGKGDQSVGRAGLWVDWAGGWDQPRRPSKRTELVGKMET